MAQTLADPVDGFTKFRQPTGFFCDSNFADLFDLAMLVVLSLLGGVLGALFNKIVEHLSHLRMHHINPSALKRSLEVLLLVLATGSVAVLLPAAFPCQHATRALMMKDSVGTCTSRILSMPWTSFDLPRLADKNSGVIARNRMLVRR